MDAGVEARLRAGDVTFGVDDAALLRAIAESGSVSAAASELGRSRSRALTRLETLESAFGSLVERRRGGSDGGGSRLTDTAHDLLARFDRLCAAVSGTAQASETVVEGTVTERTGELALVETAAGTVRALVDENAAVDSAVQVSIRADAVTLHAPDDAPAGGATSARNRFRGTVTGLDVGTAVASVTLDVGTASPLVALVTVESVERLALAVGDEVVASFKATATRATTV
ncbi:molybdate transport system regulatory protein [Halogranum rubrum]|uniref:Molybdate transport system regulatory protein n=1 Tax=Halogranum rubrum TaxID=553466 RepID=A0A1I4AZA9_9EURY|nr:TOBE domain-containing protein [Halogranum rubrum]SFK61171.1 molybdate transport system regulatory protein [Halogranum rubrum]